MKDQKLGKPPRASPKLPALAIVLCACLQATHGAGEPRPRRALASDLALKVRFVPNDGPISAGEPVVARLDLTNQSAQAVEVLTGSNQVPALHLTVRAADGQLLAGTPRPERRPDGLYGIGVVEPGGTYSVFWVVTGLYQFEQPGQYEVEVQLLDWMTWKVLCGNRAALRVLPFDVERLEARCEELFQPLRKHSSSKTKIPATARTKALYSVRHDTVLPYLDWIARELHSSHACRAMRRIGTERAQELLGTLAARDNETGEVARKALEMDLESTVRDVVW